MRLLEHHKRARCCHALGAIAASGLTVAIGAATAAGPAGAAAARPPQPNIVLIQADDQTANQFTPRVMPQTTRLLARGGTTFSDYIVTTALCCPSRASLLTGQYAHDHGVFNNNRSTGGYPALIDKNNVLPVWLRRAGYNTIHIGKFLNNYASAVPDPAQPAPGWDDWQSLISGEGRYYDYNLSDNGVLVHKGTANQDYLGRVITRKAVRAIGRYAPSPKPFYLEVDPRTPHIARMNRPGRCGSLRNAEPDPSDMDEFRNAPLPTPPSFNEADMSDKPAFLRQLPRLSELDRQHVQEHWRCALAALVGLDRSVATIFNAVRQAGELSQTVFIYISDNGQFYGEHRVQLGKVLPYEEALHEPLVIRVPRRYRHGAPRVPRSSAPVANIDLAPTILALAHGTPCLGPGARNPRCRTMDGRSLMPLLTGSGNWPSQRSLLLEYRSLNPARHETCIFDGVRTPRTVYVEHYAVADPATGGCQSTLQVERYNLKQDPFELRNQCVAGIPSNCPTSPEQSKLEQDLQRLRDCAGIQGRDQQVDGRPFCG